MALPMNLTGIFNARQKSYKMVLIHTLLDEMGDSAKEVSFSRVQDRFRKFLAYRERNNLPVDKPPRPAVSWGQMSSGQITNVIQNPINALSSILFVNTQKDAIGFKPEVAKDLNPNALKELKNEARREMDEYYRELIASASVSIKDYLLELMNNYLKSKAEPFSSHPLGIIVRQKIPQELQKLNFVDSRYKVLGSVGKGNWANIPWIAIMDKRITETTQQGEYIVYLFSENMEHVYLTFIQGVTVPLQQGKRTGYEYLEKKVEEIRTILPLESMSKDQNIFLTSSGLGRDYQVSTVAYIRYERDKMPDDETLISDLRNMMENYEMYVDLQLHKNKNDDASTEGQVEVVNDQDVKEVLAKIKQFIEEKGFHFPEHLIENFFLSLKTKPFVILAGISGTGKTKLIELFAEALGATERNGQFTLIPVRPDWSDPSDLLGYHDLSGEFKPGRLTQVFLEASKEENGDKPFFVCLDEMNLARVEHYFSDLLSVMETRRWHEGRILTDSILDSKDISSLLNPTTLGPDGNASYKLGIPQNVYIVGTVNMDETTHPFSKKVLDRAQTLEFNEINLNHFPNPSSINTKGFEKLLSNSFLKSDYLILKDAYSSNDKLIEQTTSRLVKLNDILEEVHSHIGFRVRDNICFYMVYNERFQLLTEDEAFDLQLLQKILPRLQGSHSSLKRVLIELMSVALGQKLNIEELMEDASPLYLGWKSSKDTPSARFPQSARKIAYMLRRLEEDGFTSFWLS